MKVLVSCSDQDVIEDITNALKTSYSNLELISSASLALADIDKKKSHALDMVIIDLDTKMDTFDVIKSIRSFSNSAIVAIHSKKDKSKVLRALNAGADQCMEKPIRQLEFIARIGAVTRAKKAGIT